MHKGMIEVSIYDCIYFCDIGRPEVKIFAVSLYLFKNIFGSSDMPLVACPFSIYINNSQRNQSSLIGFLR